MTMEIKSMQMAVQAPARKRPAIIVLKLPLQTFHFAHPYVETASKEVKIVTIIILLLGMAVIRPVP